jgi:hypothetical protein
MQNVTITENEIIKVTSVGSVGAAGSMRFEIPRETDELIIQLRNSANIYQPNHRFRSENVKALTELFFTKLKNGKLLSDLFMIYIDLAYSADNAAILSDWRVMLLEASKHNYTTVIEIIDEYMADINRRVNNIDDLNKDLMEDSARKFQTTAHLRKDEIRDILTEVKFTPKISSMVAEDLGKFNNFYKMLDLNDLSADNKQNQLNIALLTLMKESGVKEIKPLDPKNPASPLVVPESKIVFWSKKLIKDLVDKQPPLFFMKLKDLIPNIAVEAAIAEDSDQKTRDAITTLLNVSDDKRAKAQVAKWLGDNLYEHKKTLELIGRSKIYNQQLRTLSSKPDEWQMRMIQLVQMNPPRNVLVFVPTSAGKTFTATSTIDWQLNNIDQKVVICYVAPNFDLAFQTFNNLKKTFKDTKVSMITARTREIVNQTQVWVGTPMELWSYFQTMKITVDIAYFDEIHTISLSFGGSAGDKLTSEAMGNLMSLVTRQIIGLSATVHLDDIPGLCGFIEARSGGRLTFNYDPDHPDDGDVIILDKRIVPQTSYQWIGDRYVPLPTAPLLKQRFNGEEDSDEVVSPKEVTPETTFGFLRQLVEMGHAPALIFDDNPEDCFHNYERLIRWLKASEKRDYGVYHAFGNNHLATILNLDDAIDRYTARASEINGGFEADTTKTKSKSRNNEEAAGKSTDKRGAALKVLAEDKAKLVKQRSTLIRSIYDDLTFALQVITDNVPVAASVDADAYAGKVSSYEFLHQQTLGGYQRMLLDAQRLYLESLKFSLKSRVYPVELQDLIVIHQTFRDLLSHESIGIISPPAQSLGPFYTIGQNTKAVDQMRSMFDVKGEGYKTNIKNRNDMLLLCMAERIEESEIKPLLNLLSEGMEFGMGIILPTLPFVVHYSMLKLIRDSSIPILFSSHDMSMGINYPIRTVCIRSNTLIRMMVSMGMQMGGRSGRRGYDTFGIIVYWNILNATEMNSAHLPHIVLPNTGPAFGCQIHDVLATAMKIEEGRIYAYNDGGASNQEMLDAAVGQIKFSTLVEREKVVDIDAKNASLKEERTTQAIEAKARQEDRQHAADTNYDDDEDDGASARPSRSVIPKVVHVVAAPKVIKFNADTIQSTISSCVKPLGDVMGLSAPEMYVIINRVIAIMLDERGPEMRERAYYWAERIGMVKIAMQELYIKLHLCENIPALDNMKSTYEALHRCQTRQLQL